MKRIGALAKNLEFLPDHSPRSAAKVKERSSPLVAMYCLNPACSHPENQDGVTCLACGQTLKLADRYWAISPIAQGGFGRTFLAVDGDNPHKSRCVIKQFFPQQQGVDTREKASELFQAEAERLQELGAHDRIPTLLDFIEQENYQYLIQEFIDGQTLAQELQQSGPFDETKIRALLQELLPVLAYIHDRHVIHRDIKPANILRRTSDQALVLVDLGAAKYATGTALAQTGTFIGSAEYTAPEQTRGKAIFASDLYSLGATCITLLTQMSPFDLLDGMDDRWVWRDYLTTPISSSLGKILDKLLYRATRDRYASAPEVLRDLESVDDVEIDAVEPSRLDRKREKILTKLAESAPLLDWAEPPRSTTIQPPVSGDLVTVKSSHRSLKLRHHHHQKHDYSRGVLMFLFILTPLIIGFVSVITFAGSRSTPDSPPPITTPDR